MVASHIHRQLLFFWALIAFKFESSDGEAKLCDHAASAVQNLLASDGMAAAEEMLMTHLGNVPLYTTIAHEDLHVLPGLPFGFVNMQAGDWDLETVHRYLDHARFMLQGMIEHATQDGVLQNPVWFPSCSILAGLGSHQGAVLLVLNAIRNMQPKPPAHILLECFLSSGVIKGLTPLQRIVKGEPNIFAKVFLSLAKHASRKKLHPDLQAWWNTTCRHLDWDPTSFKTLSHKFATWPQVLIHLGDIQAVKRHSLLRTILDLMEEAEAELAKVTQQCQGAVSCLDQQNKMACFQQSKHDCEIAAGESMLFTQLHAEKPEHTDATPPSLSIQRYRVLWGTNMTTWIDLKDARGWTALLHACHAGDAQAADLLLKAGASAAVRDKVTGNTCLHFAISRGFTTLASKVFEAVDTAAVWTDKNYGGLDLCALALKNCARRWLATKWCKKVEENCDAEKNLGFESDSTPLKPVQSIGEVESANSSFVKSCIKPQFTTVHEKRALLAILASLSEFPARVDLVSTVSDRTRKRIYAGSSKLDANSKRQLGTQSRKALESSMQALRKFVFSLNEPVLLPRIKASASDTNDIAQQCADEGLEVSKSQPVTPATMPYGQVYTDQILKQKTLSEYYASGVGIRAKIRRNRQQFSACTTLCNMSDCKENFVQLQWRKNQTGHNERCDAFSIFVPPPYVFEGELLRFPWEHITAAENLEQWKLLPQHFAPSDCDIRLILAFMDSSTRRFDKLVQLMSPPAEGRINSGDAHERNFQQLVSQLLSEYSTPHTQNMGSCALNLRHSDQTQQGYAEMLMQFAIGPALSGAMPHFHSSAVNQVVTGAKLWLLFPPSCAHFYTVPVLQTLKSAVLCLTSSPAEESCVWLQEVTSKCPRLIAAAQLPHDILYIPSGWGHMVINLSDTKAVAIEGNE